MNEMRRYPLLVTLPPFFVGTALAAVFLSQVIALPSETWTWVGMAYVVVFGIGIAVLALALRKGIANLESALESGDGARVSAAMSRALVRTEVGGFLLWSVLGPLFALVAALAVLPTFSGIQRFVEGSLIIAVPAMAWTYWYGKGYLLRVVRGTPGLRYEGPRFSFASKIAMVFAGFFVVSTGALVILVTSRVSTSLGHYAVRAEEGRFTEIIKSVGTGETSPNALVAQLSPLVPEGFALHVIDPSGRVASKGGTLDEIERDRILASRNKGGIVSDGSWAYRFARFGNGIVLVLAVPVTNQEVAGEIQSWALVLAAITAAIFALATWFLVRDLTSPLEILADLSAQMSAGDFTSAKGVFSDDEVGVLAESFLSTRDDLERLIGRINESGTAVTRGVRVMGTGTGRLLESSDEQTGIAERATAAVEEIRAGAQSILRAADEVASLTNDSSSRAVELRSSAQEVARNVETLFQSVEAISSSTIEIDASAKETAKRVDFLTRIAEQVLSFVSEMDATVEQFHATSGETAVMANKMLDAASTGSQSVDETVEGIRRAQSATRRSSEMLEQLEKSIEQVALVLAVIDELAERTNLLSLNAAIIAAQAGEHEHGFSVVAEEIRELADRTRNSTREIGGIIKSVRAAKTAATDAMKNGVVEVDRSVGLSAKASSALGEIRGHAEKTHDMARQVSQALEQHAEASRHLLEVTSGMSDDVSAIQRAAADQAGATRHLAQESERVRDIAGNVRTAAGEQATAARGISDAMERIADGEKTIHDRLEKQLEETEAVAKASVSMLEIAKRNDEIAHDFNSMLKNIEKSGGEFESESERFRLRG